MRLFFILEGRRGTQIPSQVMHGVFNILTQRGFEIMVCKVEEMLLRTDQMTIAHDLYLLKSDTELSLSLAGVLHQQGARILNPYPCCLITRNKILTSHRLRSAGIPAPRSWMTGDLSLLRPILEQSPLIIKPYNGFHGKGLHIVHNPDELLAIPPTTNPVLIQEYIRGNGEDLKVYVIGEEVFAVRKPFSSTSFTRPGQRCSVSTEVRDIAQRCGRAFGLGLFGLDIIENTNGPMVVDLNYFPGYKGVTNASDLLADYISYYAREEILLELPADSKLPLYLEE